LENPDTINRIPFFKQHWVIPILLAILVLPILILLPWHNQKMEFEERQDQLIADTLWVGQGIQSRMSKDEDYIKFLGEDVATGRFTTEQIERRFSTFLETHNEFQQLIWLNAQGQILYASQPISLDDFFHRIRARQFPTRAPAPCRSIPIRLLCEVMGQMY